MTAQARLAQVILRVGAAFAFIYPPVSAYFGDPYTWVGYFPPFVLSAAHALGLSDLVLLHVFEVVEVVIGLWILSGYKIFWPSLAAGCMLVAIVLFGSIFPFNSGQLDILFRDLSIAALCFALAVMHLPPRASTDI